MKIQTNPYDVIWSAFNTYVPIIYRPVEKKKTRRVEPIEESSSPNNPRDSTGKTIDLLV